MNGKGDSARPRSICGTEWDQRWAQTFGTKHETRPVICDRCNGTGEIVEQDSEQHVTTRKGPSCLGRPYVYENIRGDD